MGSDEQIQEPTNISTSLLSSHPSNPSKKHTYTATLIVLLTCIALSAAFVIFRSSSTAPEAQASPPIQKKLNRPVVILISSDGFRFGYQFKAATPNIHRLIKTGTEAERGLIPVFPTYTFPNHYSIVTGLYPAYHGIINNVGHFIEPKTGDAIDKTNQNDSKWWLGEPLWETVANKGLKAAAYFWPGAEVHKGSWNCPPKFCPRYKMSVPFEERVDTILSYFDLPSDEIPAFMAVYFSDPDSQGHKLGPDDPQITDAVARIDSMIGRLISGLEEKEVFDDVHIIMVGDHGMVGTCDQKLIFLDDLASSVQIPANWVESYSPLLAIRPPPGSAPPNEIVAKMKQGLQSGKVKNGKYLKVYLKEDLPDRLHYFASERIPPIIGLVEEGFKVEQKRTEKQQCGGAHGYDNAFFSMRSIFIGHGPQFAKGKKVESFENVEIYNMVTSILDIKGAPNNGSVSFAKDVLLPSP